MIRLYYPLPLAEGTFLLPLDQHHYLAHVLRLKVGEILQLFNERDGEWQGSLTVLTKKEARVALTQCIRHPESMTLVHLIFSPLKNDATQFLLEKATELGVTDLWIVMTERTVNRWNEIRAQANVIMATQQCERLDPPRLHPPQKLPIFLKSWNKPLLWASERGGGDSPFLKDALVVLQEPAFLIGPEGGFSPLETQLLHQQPFVHPFTLGPRILRAETAALSCLAMWLYGHPRTS